MVLKKRILTLHERQATKRILSPKRGKREMLYCAVRLPREKGIIAVRKNIPDH